MSEQRLLRACTFFTRTILAIDSCQSDVLSRAGLPSNRPTLSRPPKIQAIGISESTEERIAQECGQQLTAVNRLQPYRRFKSIKLPDAKLERCPPLFNLTLALLLRGSRNTPPLQLPRRKRKSCRFLTIAQGAVAPTFAYPATAYSKSPADLPFFACGFSARNLSYGARIN